MKNILGHKSWSEEEILSFFDKGNFTMCSLPHYRYNRVRAICANLKRCGLIKKIDLTQTGVNYIATPEFHKWRSDVANGLATSSLQKLYKLLNPPVSRTKSCEGCGNNYETFDRQQRFCKSECRKLLIKESAA